MTPEALATLYADLKRDEGVMLRAYTDSVGVWTVGVGHNLEARPLSTRAVDVILEDDVADTLGDLDRALPWWRTLDPARQRLLANLGFNLGISRLLGFRRFLAALHDGRFDEAAEELIHSAWATQVGARAFRLARLCRTGQDA